MYEVQRHQYLSAMGIDSYMPRLLLPNGPEVFECEWPPQLLEQAAANTPEPGLSPEHSLEHSSEHSPELRPGLSSAPEMMANTGAVEQSMPQFQPTATNSVPAIPISANADKAANALLAELGSDKPAKLSAAKTSAEKISQAVEEAQTDTQVAKAVSFTLSIWRLDKILVVDTRDSSKALPTEKLLLSMLRALDIPLGNLPKAQILGWPMLEGGIADESAEAARDMLSAFFDTGTVEHDTWLLMGEAAKIALPEAMQATAAGVLLDAGDLDSRFHSKDDLKVAILPSLVEMLEQPKLKASAWQALQQL